jgi:ABC-type phosphate transport system substrate-binding protein
MQKKFLIIGLLVFVCASISSAQVSVIANKNLKSDKINLATLKDIYNLDTQSLNGEKVKLFDFSSDNSVKNNFYSAINTNPAEIKKVWLKAKLTGGGNPPVNVSSEDEMINKVSSTDGAIGFVSSSKVSDKVKVLLEIK